jgi:choline monooxygenase
LLFVALEQPIVSLEELFSGVRERICSVDLSSLQFHSREMYEINCNWKAYIDNYLEGYHVPIVHPELMKLYDFNQYKTDTYEWYSLQHSPLSEGEVLYSERVKEGGVAEALYYFVFPNLMLNILPGRLQTNIIQPIDENRCRVIFDYYYEDITSPEALVHIEADIRFSESVQQEDIEICELVQRGLKSSAYDRGRFSVKRENAVYHFQSLLKKMFKDGMKEKDQH